MLASNNPSILITSISIYSDNFSFSSWIAYWTKVVYKQCHSSYLELFLSKLIAFVVYWVRLIAVPIAANFQICVVFLNSEFCFSFVGNVFFSYGIPKTVSILCRWLELSNLELKCIVELFRSISLLCKAFWYSLLQWCIHCQITYFHHLYQLLKSHYWCRQFWETNFLDLCRLVSTNFYKLCLRSNPLSLFVRCAPGW